MSPPAARGLSFWKGERSVGSGGNSNGSGRTRVDRLRKAAELLGENYALDTTLREVLRILPEWPNEGAGGASSPGSSAESGSGVAQQGEQSSGVPNLPVFALEPPPQDDPRHRGCIAAFCTTWRGSRGGDYRVVGARDGTALKRLLSEIPGVTVDEFQRRAAFALSDAWFRRSGTIAHLCSHWSGYAPEAPRPTSQPKMNGHRVVVGIDPQTGLPRYA